MFLLLAPYFGYAASLFLIIALLVKTDAKFRLYNILGCLFFIAYGTIFSFWPVVLTNAILLVINVYYLIKLYQHAESFTILPVVGNEAIINHFISFYKVDIATYFPAFEKMETTGTVQFAVLRDMVIANIFSATLLPNGIALVNINYTIKKYRDFKIGSFIFEKEKAYLLSKGITAIQYNSVANKKHEEFLRVSGFMQQGKGWVKEL